jgi:hypothetical protein
VVNKVRAHRPQTSTGWAPFEVEQSVIRFLGRLLCLPFVPFHPHTKNVVLLYGVHAADYSLARLPPRFLPSVLKIRKVVSVVGPRRSSSYIFLPAVAPKERYLRKHTKTPRDSAVDVPANKIVTKSKTKSIRPIPHCSTVAS